MGHEPELVNDRFFRMASKFGDRPALVYRSTGGWRHWTYRELAERASRIANHLRARGVVRGAAVGVIASREPETIAAILGILEAGACFVPLDPANPEPRLRALCEDSGLHLVVSAKPLPDSTRLPSFVSVVQTAASANDDTARLASMASAAAELPVYVMFTSGSTGEPKGVVVPHSAVIRLVDDPNFMRLDETRVILHLAPLSFDASTLELWGALLNGGACALYPDDWMPTAAGMKTVVREASITTAWLTASLFNAIVDQDVTALTGIEELLAGGEALSVPHVVKALRALPQTQLINGYGPTENTTFTACYRIPAAFSASESSVPIGLPISGTDVVIVDETLKPVPDGTEGELLAMGAGLALGYLNKPELTDERFVQVATASGGTARAYRTGDRVVRRADGLLAYLGRFDDQVKIEGHRIEPKEIEHVVMGLGNVDDCRVLVRTSPAGQKRLAAYVVTSDRAPRDLRHELSGVLPAFMVPHFFFFLDALPVNANGKLDKSKLPDPFAPQAPAAPGVRSAEMELVAAAWEELLGRQLADIDLNFFDAGGTSLDAVLLHDSLVRRVGRTLDPMFVFEHATIRRQADALRAGSPEEQGGLTRGQQRRGALARHARGRS